MHIAQIYKNIATPIYIAVFLQISVSLFDVRTSSRDGFCAGVVGCDDDDDDDDDWAMNEGCCASMSPSLTNKNSRKA